MAQADYVVANGTGAAVRSDLNGQLAAIVSNNSGATEPATMYAYQWWTDTTAGLLKLRNSANSAWITMRQLDGEFSTVPVENGTAAAPSIYFKDSGTDSGFFSPGTDAVAISTAGTNRLHITSAGLVGIGTSPSSLLHLSTAGASYLQIQNTTAANSVYLGNSSGNGIIQVDGANSLNISTNGSERCRVDSSGRLLVGTPTARTIFENGAASAKVQVEGTDNSTSRLSVIRNGGGGGITLAGTAGASVGSIDAVANNATLGEIAFAGSDGTDFVNAANISAHVDGTPGANDMPGRLVFSTTADGASSPTERMRIQQNGNILFGTTTADPGILNTVVGSTISAVGYASFSRNDTALYVSRTATDGSMVSFQQGGTEEGSISVSGTTVSYNGAHLSRWSQLPSGAERTEILRGSILSNIDEMCEWGDEENEQLNRMKVSDVEGDKNVSGVFQAWDDDDDTYTDDFYCAMTGDFIIRIAEGVTVERGDLLMSAGDGTAKPQDDDIIRSKTIAKVTSTNVSCTYDDGSYCVPCVLMAC
jgi:hypothetical protein